jgi:hypothetical protein
MPEQFWQLRRIRVEGQRAGADARDLIQVLFRCLPDHPIPFSKRRRVDF